MEQRQEYNLLYYYMRERFVVPFRLSLYRWVRLALVILILSLVANFMFSYFFYTPKMWALRKANNELVTAYEELNNKISTDMASLAEIRSRDNSVYRSMFALDSLSIAGVWNEYDESKYADVKYGRYEPLMMETWHYIDALTRQLYAESISLEEIENYAANKDLLAESIPAIWPMDRKLLRGHIGAFGGRRDPGYGYWAMHQGIDLAANLGTPIYATATGTVIADNAAGYGIQVMLDHGFGYKTRYAHLSSKSVQPGQVVKRGEQIGRMGNTGRSYGNHLHYEVIYRGRPVNPINYMSRDLGDDEYREIIARAKETIYE